VRLAYGGVVVVAAVALAGCGGGSSDAKQRRDAVNAYIDRVDRAQGGLVSSAGEIDRAFRNFKLSGNGATELRELTFARERIGTALQRVRAIVSPPEARQLHADLLQMLTLQHAAADELLRVATYEPQLTRALTPLGVAGKALASEIRQAAKTQPPPASVSAADRSGAAVWAQAGCGTCHALTATGSTGTTGPNLDALQLSAAQIAAQVRSGGSGMPPFAKRLSPAKITALALFVSTAESRQSANSAVLDAYAAAFRHYGDSVGRVLDGLERLDAPPVLRPSFLAERETLGRAATLSGSAAAALHRLDVRGANKAIKQLFASAAAAGQASTQRAVAAAVRAYNARLNRIGVLAAKVTRERQRLVQQVG
jgi:mono/diheme cytochrome c family protein